MNFISYKNRNINFDKKVEVYRNLHNDKLSIRQNNIVIGYTDEIILKEVEFIVRSSGKKLAITNNQRNVHAFVKGYIFDEFIRHDLFMDIVTYNPFINKGFHKINGEEITKIDKVLLKNNKCYV